jgi:hypothetical protein
MSFKLARDPALYLFLIATGVRLFSAFILHVDEDTQALINAFATAVGSAVVAVVVVKDKQVPVILGAVQALLALAVGLGLDVSGENQALIMSMIGGLAAAFVRTQVVAPVTAEGDKQLA